MSSPRQIMAKQEIQSMIIKYLLEEMTSTENVVLYIEMEINDITIELLYYFVTCICDYNCHYQEPAQGTD